MMKEKTAFIARCPAWDQARRMGTSCLKDLNSLKAFKERFFKDWMKEKVSRCMISLCTHFWWVDDEVTGWYFSSENHQPLVLTSLELPVGGQPAVNFFHLTKVLAPANSTRIWFGILSMSLEEELKVVDFVLYLNHNIILSCLTIFLCFCISSLLQLSLPLGIQRRTKRGKLFYRQKQRTLGFFPERSCRVLLLPYYRTQ